MLDVSIIIVSWNTKQILCDCLESVFGQDSGVSYEVFVVDNASSDGSAQMVRDRFPQVKLIANEDNRGFAAANNQAMRIAQGRYILLLNSDTVVLDDAIGKMVHFADGQAGVGVSGCKILNKDRTLQSSCFMYPSVLNMILSATYLYKIFRHSRFFGREAMSWWERDNEREVDVVTGCFMLIRREVVEQIGLLDEDYFIYGEETDFCYRAKQAGWQIVFNPAAQIVHLGGASSRLMKPEMTLQLRGSILLFIRKNKSFAEYVFCCLLTSLFFMVRVPMWLFRAFIKPKMSKQAFKVARTYISGAFRSLGGAGWLRYRKK